MYAPCCLAFLLFFLVNVSRNGAELFVSGSTQASSHLPRSFRQASCSRNVHHFPCLTKFRGLSVLLLLCGDISLNPGPISFGVVNCRSVRNKGPSISDIMSTHSLSLLAMTETHIRPTDNDSFLHSITPAGFKLCHRLRSHGFGGGVGFFLNENIKFKILDSPTYISFENTVIGIGSSTSPFTIACVYQPPGSCSDEFFDQFLNLFEYLSSVSSSFFMCGDFNIHVDTTSRDSTKFLNCLDSCNITQHVRSPTHLHGHILDLVLTPTEPTVVSNVRVGGFFSDHAIVHGQLDLLSPSAPKSNTVTFRRYHKINMQSLMCDLANCSFVASPGSTVSALYEQYIRDLSVLLDKHAPTITRTFTKGAAGWLSDTYLQAKAVRHQFERFWRKDKSPLNWTRLSKQIARCNTLITRDKSNYYRNLISDNAHDSKKLWQVLRSVLHSVPDKVLPSHASHIGLANCFVTFFSDKISKIRDSFTNTDSFTLPAPSDVPKFDLYKSVSEDEVRKVITKSPTKSCLLDPWPTFLVKECLDILLPSITKLVNCSLTVGAVPAGFKKAIVSPVIKKSSLPPDELKNYRPVSGLSCISKLV